MNRGNSMKTIDYKFAELCEEIDMWKAEAYYWKEQYCKATKSHSEMVSEDIKNNYNFIGTVFSALLDEDSVLNKVLISSKDE